MNYQNNYYLSTVVIDNNSLSFPFSPSVFCKMLVFELLYLQCIEKIICDFVPLMVVQNHGYSGTSDLVKAYKGGGFVQRFHCRIGMVFWFLKKTIFIQVETGFFWFLSNLC